MTGITPKAPGAPAAAAGAPLVRITIPGDNAPAFAGTRVEEGRAAGVNRLPGVRSTYSREGRIEEAEEALQMVKTTVAGDPARECRLREPCPYDIPGVPALPGAAGSGPSLDSLSRSVTVA
jgi:periplasmic divalent cation tolerance protein